MAWIWTHRDFFEDFYDKELPAQIFQDEEVEHDKEAKSTSKDGKYGGSVDKAHDCDKKHAANVSSTHASDPQGICGHPTRSLNACKLDGDKDDGKTFTPTISGSTDERICCITKVVSLSAAELPPPRKALE